MEEPPTTKRGRKKEPAGKEISSQVASKPEEPKEPVKRSRVRAKKATSDEPETTQAEEVEQPVEQPVKKSRGRAASSRKAAEVEQKEVEPKEAEQKVEEQPAKKRGAKKKEEASAASQEPAVRSARGRSRTQRTQTEQDEQPLATKTRTRKASESKDEPAVEQQVEPELEKPKRGRRATSKVESSAKDAVEKAAIEKTTGRGRRAASKTKQLEEAMVDDQIAEQEQPVKRGKTKAKSAEEVEAPAEPATRKGRGKAKKDEVVETSAKSIAGKRIKKKTVEEAEEAASSYEKVSKPSDLSVITEKLTDEVVEDEEDDNKSEKELVIDLKEDLPPLPKKRGRKAKTAAEVPVAETTKSQPSEPVAADSQPIVDSQPAAKRGRAKKQPKIVKSTGDEETEVPTEQSKRKPVSDDDKVSEADQHLEQPLEEGASTDPIEADEKQAEGQMQVDTEPPVTELCEERPVEPSKDLEEEIQEEQPEEEKQDEEMQDDERHEDQADDRQADGKQDEERQEDIADESASSQFDQDKVNSDVHTVLDDIKSLVETSQRDLKSGDSTIDDTSSTSLNETGEVISAKELEEYTSDDDGLKITYNSIINVNETKATSELPSTSNTPSFTLCSESEANARKRIKLFDTDTELAMPSIVGKLISFGQDSCGELGRQEVGTERQRPGQLRINETDSFCYICSQAQHSAVISTSGRLYTFGNNDECALGRPTDSDENLCATPTPVNSTLSLYKICKVTVGDSHTAALTTSGSVLYWGNFRDSNGSVGLTASILTPSLQPIAVELGLDIVSIASGGNFLLLLDSYGVVHSMGIGERGELGRFPDEEHSKFDNKTFDREQRARHLEPQPIVFPKNAKIDAIWASEYGAFARATDSGQLFAWGLNNYGQLGIAKRDDNDLCVYEPREISYFAKSGVKIEKIAGSQHHTLMLDDKGRVYACGRHEYGRLGLGVISEDPVTPKLIERLKSADVVDIACCSTASYAVTGSGELYSWGAAAAELGLGEKANEEHHWEPTQVQSTLMKRFRCLRVTAGATFCLALGQLTDDVNNNKHNGLC